MRIVKTDENEYFTEGLMASQIENINIPAAVSLSSIGYFDYLYLQTRQFRFCNLYGDFNLFSLS